MTPEQERRNAFNAFREDSKAERAGRRMTEEELLVREANRHGFNSLAYEHGSKLSRAIKNIQKRAG